MRSPAPLLLVCAVLALSTLSCLSNQEVAERTAADTDPKLSRFAFIEEGQIATLIVSTRATTFREKEAYMPLEFCVANRGLPSITLTRESFTLVDADGTRYPAAEPEELIQGYKRLDQDRLRFSELFNLVATRFSTFDAFPAKISPTRAGRPVQSSVEVPKFGVAIDFVYFPMPKTGLKGQRFELFVDAPELEDPLFVRFVVP